jgi:hypothetical protein
MTGWGILVAATDPDDIPQYTYILHTAFGVP